VLFFIELSTRKVEIAGTATNANGLWMSQIGRNLTDPVDGLLTKPTSTSVVKTGANAVICASTSIFLLVASCSQQVDAASRGNSSSCHLFNC
jgi:hypothetical protein